MHTNSHAEKDPASALLGAHIHAQISITITIAHRSLRLSTRSLGLHAPFYHITSRAISVAQLLSIVWLSSTRRNIPCTEAAFGVIGTRYRRENNNMSSSTSTPDADGPSPPECKFSTFLLRRTISSSSTQKQPPLRIAYRIIRPSLLNPLPTQQAPAPIIVIHGGPSLPSEYLTPLAQASQLQNRSIIFYDQLGCGWSSIPQQDDWYGVLQMGRDLDELIHHLQKTENIARYHLLGHSLGGAIGYELLKSQIEKSRGKPTEADTSPRCLSFILSNASTNFKLSSTEQMRLFNEFQLQNMQTQMQSKKQQTKSLSINDRFFQTHICRTSVKPPELVSALSRRGKEWSANDYTAISLDRGSNGTEILTGSRCTMQFPPVLIVSGELDFVTETCTSGWKDLLKISGEGRKGGLKEVVLKDCAHYPHFEQPDSYSSEIEKFCSDVESR